MSNTLPSRRWTSFENWDYNGMRERLEALLAKLDKGILLQHVELITGKKCRMSEPFSAGQYWICFEIIAEDGRLVIARVRLPRHPQASLNTSEKDEQYAIECEIATMRLVRQRLPSLAVPQVYAYETPESQFAIAAGAAYMLIEGFYGNTLQDIAPDLCSFPLSKLDHIMGQWTTIQASLATLTYPLIGSISAITQTGEPVIGRLSSAASEGLISQGPFRNAVDYFTALGEAAFHRVHASSNSENPSHFYKLGTIAFIDIVQSTTLFKTQQTQYPLNHMDLGTQNVIVDNDFNFLAVIDWEFAQTAPWPVNHYPMPFPLLWSDERIQNILNNPQHLAHKNVSKQAAARQLYSKKFREAAAKLARKGFSLSDSFPEVLQGAASRVYACFSRLGCDPEQDEGLVNEMARLAFDFDSERTKQYLEELPSKYINHGGDQDIRCFIASLPSRS